jgi:hypothetical protein
MIESMAAELNLPEAQQEAFAVNLAIATEWSERNANGSKNSRDSSQRESEEDSPMLFSTCQCNQSQF